MNAVLIAACQSWYTFQIWSVGHKNQAYFKTWTLIQFLVVFFIRGHFLKATKKMNWKYLPILYAIQLVELEQEGSIYHPVFKRCPFVPLLTYQNVISLHVRIKSSFSCVAVIWKLDVPPTFHDIYETLLFVKYSRATSSKLSFMIHLKKKFQGNIIIMWTLAKNENWTLKKFLTYVFEKKKQPKKALNEKVISH